MAKNTPTTPPKGEEVLRAMLGSTSYVVSPVFSRFECAVQALDAAVAAEEAVYTADVAADATSPLCCDARRQVNAAYEAFEAVIKAPVVLEGDDKMALASKFVSMVLALADPGARCNAAISAAETLPFLKVRSRQPQAREVDRIVRLAFQRLERLEELMFHNASCCDSGPSFR